jgi:hypothetical protein
MVHIEFVFSALIHVCVPSSHFELTKVPPRSRHWFQLWYH